MGTKANQVTGNLFKRRIRNMPEGYYSGDKPNRNLRAFVEQHIKERPYDPETDNYNAPAFDKPIEATKATAIYNMHTYWSKKPHDAIREYIRHYTKPGDLVLDPFCGSGGTALAALMEGRKAIAIDRSPAATFITKNYCTPVDVEELQKAFDELKRKVKPEIDWLYETRCDRCGGKATTAYTVYSQVFQCPRCLEKVPLFDCVEIDGETAKGKSKKVSVCPFCLKKGHEEIIRSQGHKFGSVPMLVSYFCESGCRPVRSERRYNDSNKKKHEYFEKYDLAKLREIEAKKIPHWYPDAELAEVIPYWMLFKKDFRPTDAQRLVDLFTKRNLWALAAILDAATHTRDPYDDILRFTVTSFLLNLSKLYKHREGGGGQPTGNYYIPQINRENEAWASFERKYKDVLEAHSLLPSVLKCSEVIVSTDTAVNLNSIPSNSVDLVFTDPPYAGKYQYGELNFVWEAWLQLDTQWYGDEITINEIRGKTEADWTNLMRQAMTESFRVLKPGRWLSLCYHDTSEGTWSLVQDIMAEVGFLPDTGGDALYIDTGQKTYNQSQAEKVTKRDLVINFRKPKHGEITAAVTITGDEDETTFSEKVRQIIRDYIGANPGCTKDRIYDEVVSRMVRSGRMEPHDFHELLSQVAEEVKIPVKKDLFRNEEPNLFGTHEVGRWYLKETELAVADSAETAREDIAAEKLSAFIKVHLKKHPGDEGVHYSDLFEHYIYAVKDKPRRQLADFLPDYFYKTEQGTWRLPASEEEERTKREARVKGLGRRVKRFIAQLEHGVAIPDHERPNDGTLAEWIRHCKRSGLYELGKLLYERGGLNLDKLLEEVMANVEEDYQVCVRMLARSGGEEKKITKRGLRKMSEDEE